MVSKVTGHLLEQPNTQRNVTAISTFKPQNFLHKKRFHDRKGRKSLKYDMPLVKYGQNKVLNRHNGKLVKTNIWNPLFR